MHDPIQDLHPLIESPSFPLKTTQVADLIDEPYGNLMAAVRDRRLKAPRKDYSGHFMWQKEDVKAARALFANGRRRRRAAKIAAAAAAPGGEE